MSKDIKLQINRPLKNAILRTGLGIDVGKKKEFRFTINLWPFIKWLARKIKKRGKRG